MDKLETEKRLYQLTAEFFSALESVVFNCSRTEDRMFILRWSGSLLDIRMEHLLSFASNGKLRQIAESTLAEFSHVLKKGDDICTLDKETYHKEQEKMTEMYYALAFRISDNL